MDCDHEDRVYVGVQWYSDGVKRHTWQCRTCGILLVEEESCEETDFRVKGGDVGEVPA